METTRQSLYQMYLKKGNGRWEWFCDLLTMSHEGVLAKAEAALKEDSSAGGRPLRLEHVQDYPMGGERKA